MEFTGKVIGIMEMRSGVSSKGSAWAVQAFWLEEVGKEFPESIVVDVWDEALRDWLTVNKGATVTICISSRAKEYNGRTYNNLVCRKASFVGKDAATGEPATEEQRPKTGQQQRLPIPPQQQRGSNGSELPF